MANPFITTAAPTTIVDPESQALQRQKQYAAMLLQQNQQPQGQMVGGHFVAPSWTQQLNSALNPILGGYMMNKADEAQLALQEKQRQETAQGLMEYNRLRYGQQGTPDVVPQGQTLRDDEGNLTYGSQAGTPTVQANPAAAYAYALRNKSPTVYNMAMEMLKPQKLAEGERIVTYNPNTGKEEVVMQGGEKYHAPISVDTGTGTVLLDPRTMKPVASYGKSVAGQVLETENGPVIVDTRTKQATPIMMNGQPVTGGKPLTGEPAKTVAGAMSYQDALNDYLGTIKGLSNVDMMNPQTRAKVAEKYNTVVLTGKNAHALGVLNGGDERILTGLTPNFSNPLITTQTIEATINGQKNFAKNIVENTYATAQKSVPQSVKSKFEGKPVAEPTKPSTATQKTGVPALRWNPTTQTWEK